MSATQWQWRPLEQNDLPAVLELSLLGGYSDWRLETFQSCFKQNYYAWVLSSENILGAFLVVLLNLDELEILNLAVHPAMQRQGLADQLLGHLIEFSEMKKLTRLHLEVRADNLPAISLYEKHHFFQVGCRKNYYVTQAGSQDALLFSRGLVQ